MLRAWAGLLLAFTLSAQPPSALLSSADAHQLGTRMVELMESTGAVLPELQLASAPLVAGAKNTLAALDKQGGNATLTAQFARQARAFLAIADATPKPYPFPETASKQLAELRDDYDRLESHLGALVADKEFQTRNPDRDNVKRYTEPNGPRPSSRRQPARGISGRFDYRFLAFE